MTTQISGSTGISVNGAQFLIGQVVFMAGANAPNGFLKCNGQLVSRTTYASLFAVIGTIYGAGDGSTTFAVPDLRGEFIRCLDDGRGVDVGRVLGSAQGDLIKQHNHSGFVFVNGYTFAASGRETALGGANLYSDTGMTGGAETRPRNIAMLACIFTGV